MALKALLARKELDQLRNEMTTLAGKNAELEARETELRASLEEASTEDEINAVREAVTAFNAEHDTYESAVRGLQARIDAKEEELRTLEAAAPSVRSGPALLNTSGASGAPYPEKKEVTSMPLRAFAHMSPERRDAILARADVNEFAEQLREKFRHNRAVFGADLLIPDVVLAVLHENIENYSKLISRVRTVSLSGTARQTIMSDIPEAVWTEATGALNEMYFGMNQVETDGYKVGGYVPISNPTLEDTNPSLVNEIILGLARAIGKSIDKAILFGTGTKMPLGFVTRLAQSAKPSDYPAKARDWEDLRSSNIITIPSSKTGLALFQSIVTASGSAKGNFSNGNRFWCMTDATYTKLVTEAMSINVAGAITTGMTRTMPIIGGNIITMGDGGYLLADDCIYGGYGDEYLLVQRAGTSIGYSDLPLYLQDQTVFKATARYDGIPVIPEGFVAIGLGAAPVTSAAFPPDLANKADATLRDLAVGALTLTPAFAPATTSYSAETTNDSDVVAFITATGATAKLTVGGKTVTPGKPVKWASGDNAVAVTVSHGGETKTYTVTVKKS